MLAVAPSFVPNQEGQAVVVFLTLLGCSIFAFHNHRVSFKQMHKEKTPSSHGNTESATSVVCVQ